MKKNEALELANEKAQVVLDNLSSILSNNVDGDMFFEIDKINNENVCVVHIYDKKSRFEKHINLEITLDHSNILYDAILNKFADEIFNHKYIGISRYYIAKSNLKQNFQGIDAFSITGSKIKLHMQIDKKIVKKYNERYDEFLKFIENKKKTL